VAGKENRKDVLGEAATAVYQTARAEAELEIATIREEMEAVRQESFGLGAIKAIDATIAYNEVLRLMTLYRVKQNKDYKAGGMTWKQFCEAVGTPDRTVDLMIAEIKPLYDTFFARVADLCGYDLSKIRLLGKSISASVAEIKDNALVYGDEVIPLTPEYRDDIQALIERIEETGRTTLIEAQATIKAKDQVLEKKEKRIQKQDKEIEDLEAKVTAKKVNLNEGAFLQVMNRLRLCFDDDYMPEVNPETAMVDFPEVTPRMRAALISTIDYMKMEISAAYAAVVNLYGDPALIPELDAEINAFVSDYEAWATQNPKAGA
jgi:hypothetical protein